MDATIAGLRKKYGAETIKTVPDSVQYFAWLIDEQGKLLPATPQFGRGYAGSIVGPPLGGDPTHPNSVGFALATGPVTPSSVAAMMRDPCRSHVHVSAHRVNS